MKTYFELIWLKIRFYVLILIYKIQDLFTFKSGDKMFGGELVISASGEVEIGLKSNPKTVKVTLDNECVVVPCNPHHHDHLHWHVKNLHQNHKHDHKHDHCNHKDEFVLVIKWDVHSIRLVKWMVHY